MIVKGLSVAARFARALKSSRRAARVGRASPSRYWRESQKYARMGARLPGGRKLRPRKFKMDDIADSPNKYRVPGQAMPSEALNYPRPVVPPLPGGAIEGSGTLGARVTRGDIRQAWRNRPEIQDFTPLPEGSGTVGARVLRDDLVREKGIVVAEKGFTMPGRMGVADEDLINDKVPGMFAKLLGKSKGITEGEIYGGIALTGLGASLAPGLDGGIGNLISGTAEDLSGEGIRKQALARLQARRLQMLIRAKAERLHGQTRRMMEKMAVENPQLVNELLAGGSLPRGAYTIGGGKRTDLLEQAALGLVTDEQMAPQPAVVDMARSLGLQ